MTRRFSLALALLSLTTALALADDAKPKRELVQTILDVKLVMNMKKPSTLTLMARGAVPTGGWTDAQLEPAISKTPPADGIYEFRMTAVPPTGSATQVISKVRATHAWKNPPATVKGVKVLGVGRGVKIVRFDDAKK